MELTVTPKGEQAHIEVVGSIDERGAEELKRRFLELDVSALKEVVFDFGGVTFIGSAGIGKLLVLYNKVAQRNVSIRLVNVPADIYTLFHSMKLDQLFSLSRN